MKNTHKVSKICLVCGDIFYNRNKKYCSRKCSLTQTVISKQDHSNNLQRTKNAKIWNRGLKMSDEFKKEKMNLSGLEIGRGFNKGKKLLNMSGDKHPMWKSKTVKTCEYCGKEILLPPWRIRTKKYFCNRECWALGTRGKGSPVFKGDEAVGILRTRIMELPEHKKWHADCLKQDNYTCVGCGAKRNLEVHHRKRFLHIVEENNIKTTEDARNCQELWDTTNGQTLCKECHRKTDNYGTKNLRKKLSA
jgi:hypothetical protein